MEQILAAATKVTMLMGALSMVLPLVIAVFMLIPGREPERSLRRVLNWIKRHSRK